MRDSAYRTTILKHVTYSADIIRATWRWCFAGLVLHYLLGDVYGFLFLVYISIEVLMACESVAVHYLAPVQGNRQHHANATGENNNNKKAVLGEPSTAADTLPLLLVYLTIMLLSSWILHPLIGMVISAPYYSILSYKYLFGNRPTAVILKLYDCLLLQMVIFGLLISWVDLLPTPTNLLVYYLLLPWHVRIIVRCHFRFVYDTHVFSVLSVYADKCVHSVLRRLCILPANN